MLQYTLMSGKPTRVYESLDISKIKEQLLIYGDLAGQCAKCNAMNVNLNAATCPECGTEFKFITFRNVKTNLPKIEKSMAQRPSIKIIDFDDYKRHTASQKAKDIFG